MPAVTPYYAFNRPGEAIELFAGKVEFQDQVADGRVILECSGELDLNWEVSNAPRASWGRIPVELKLSRPHGDHTVVGRQRGFDHGWLDAASMGRPAPRLQSVIAHWLNLPDLPDDPWSQVVDGWLVTIAARPDLLNSLAAADNVHGIVMTHAMRIERANASLFRPDEVEPVLAALQFGLSFGAGRWVSPTLPVGLDQGGDISWERWSEDFCTPGRRPFVGEWLNFNRDDDVRCLIETCVRRFADDWERRHVWIPAMAIAVQANARDLRVEQRIMVLQPGLEMIAHVILRQDLNISNSQCAQLGVADKLRHALAAASVPVGLDAVTYPHLEAYRKGQLAAGGVQPKALDGPTLTTRIRHHITHPTPNRGATTAQRAQAQVRDAAMFESALLSHEYLILLILKRLGYAGHYRPTAPTKDQCSVPWN